MRVFAEGYGGQNGMQNTPLTWRSPEVRDQQARFVLLWAQGGTARTMAVLYSATT
jgi:hypothetical protein